MQGDNRTCPFIRSEDEYEASQARARRQKQGDAGSLVPLFGPSYAGLKEELNEFRQILDTLICDVHKIKSVLAEPEPTLPVAEPKKEVDSKKFEIVVDSSAVGPIFLVLVGVVIGIIVAVMWK